MLQQEKKRKAEGSPERLYEREHDELAPAQPGVTS